eukprot:TRINITY_DN8812_c0_g1_i1.p1 TRINITY_DN8812_c0_g1~~TRINITY_DN8812_c0_g1_i1.p1  ORF type:complete len:743 (+),score=179.20 TRINITY_DN8812_c0_g1_i1:54-2231(+)
MSCAFLLGLLLFTVSAADVDVGRLNRVIDSSVEQLFLLHEQHKMWNMPSYLGTNFISQYSIVLGYLNIPDEKTLLNRTVLRNHLLNDQLPDGSWQQVPEKNRDYGEIDTTIFNYWALKVMNTSLDSEVMRKARDWIKGRGGLEGSSTMTKIWLDLFGNQNWNDFGWLPAHSAKTAFIWSAIPFISGFVEAGAGVPLSILDEHSLFGTIANAKNTVAQWVYPHLIPIALLRRVQALRFVSSIYCLPELSVAPQDLPCHKYFELKQQQQQPPFSPSSTTLKEATHEILNAVDKMLAIQQPFGSFGAYTVSSLFSVIALSDFVKRFPVQAASYKDRISTACTKAMNFVETMYFKSGPSIYKGVLDDGHLWDTALISLAIMSVNESFSKDPRLISTGQYLAAHQQANGGVPFGVDFEYAPDTDDTAETIMVWLRLGMKKEAQAGIDWLLTMQNPNGGWPAFDVNKEGSLLYEAMARQLMDSAELFDPSSVDVTAHILEALGLAGYTSAHPQVKAALEYMRKEQLLPSKGIFTNRAVDPNVHGAMSGRWGLNYVYGTGAALVGAYRVGGAEEMRQPYIFEAVKWLHLHQNTDGGWGEASMSYKEDYWAGRGVSTSSQTAWAVLGLLDFYAANVTSTPSLPRVTLRKMIDNGINYLLNNYEVTGRGKEFIDQSCTGTGHRRLLFMVYPSYRFAFSLLALGRYREMVSPENVAISAADFSSSIPTPSKQREL